MRSVLLASLTLALAVLPARGVLSSPYKQADEYFGVRDRALLAETIKAEEIQTQPDKFTGRLVEVRGIIKAMAGSSAQTTLLVEAAEGTEPVAVVLPADRKPAAWTFIDVGAGVRLLCRVVTVAGSSTGSLEAVIAVKEHEAASIDKQRADEEAIRKAAEARKKATPTPPLASRGIGGGTIRAAVQQQVAGRGEVLQKYADAVRYFNRRLSPGEARRIASTIIEYSVRYGLDARLVMAVIACESNFNQSAVSPVGAMGLGQLMPGTANDLGVGNAWDIRQNLEGSTRLLSSHIRNMSSDGRPTEEAVKLALACYNAGAGAVKKYRGIPPYRETRNYVAKITRLYRQMCGFRD